MKYTNIKKLLIKFMGGGLINFPTRFLRWIKIDGDSDGSDGGGGGDEGGGEGDDFPYQPGKVKYWVLDIYREGTHTDPEDNRKVIIDGEVIPAEELNDYIDEHWTSGGDQLQFLPMFDKDNFKNNLCYSSVIVDANEKRIGTYSEYSTKETTYNGKEYYIGNHNND